MASPLGLLFLARNSRGLRYLEFMDRRSLKRTIAGHEHLEPDAAWEASLLDLKPVVDQLESYFSGTLKRFTVGLDPDGTPFQHAVWKALLDIPFAQTRSYGEVARTIRQPRAARAVGLANNQNPIAIIVPCHRVIGAGGSLVGYGGGVHRKKWLLLHEERFARLDARELATRAPSPTAHTNAVRASARGAAPPSAVTRARTAVSPRTSAGTRAGSRKHTR